MVIAIDFDGTCVTHEFPKIGEDIGAVPVLKALVEKGHQLILWTMRSDKEDVASEDYDIHNVAGKYLTEAVNWFKENDIPLYGVQSNPTQSKWTSSPKAYAQLYIDDAALGIPLSVNVRMEGDEKLVTVGRHFVDWDTVKEMLEEKGIL